MGSFPKGVVDGRSAANNGGHPAVDKGVDFAQYFCTYAFLYHQKEMLSDRVRMDAYFNSIFQNKHHFNGKVYATTFLASLLVSGCLLEYNVERINGLVFGLDWIGLKKGSENVWIFCFLKLAEL